MSIEKTGFNVAAGSKAEAALKNIKTAKKQMLDGTADRTATAKTDIHLTLQKASDKAKGVKAAKGAPVGVANKDTFRKINPDAARAIEEYKNTAKKSSKAKIVEGTKNIFNNIASAIKKHPVVAAILIAIPVIGAAVYGVKKVLDNKQA